MHAQELLQDSLLAEAFYAVEADIIEQIRQVKLDDRDGHSRLTMALQISTAMRRQLWLLIQDGEHVRHELNLRGKRID